MTNKDDKQFYLIANEELEEGIIDTALWAKCLTLNKGDEKATKYDYLNMRVEEEIKKTKHKQEEAHRAEAERLAEAEAEAEAKRLAQAEAEAEIYRQLIAEAEAERLAEAVEERVSEEVISEKPFSRAIAIGLFVPLLVVICMLILVYFGPL